MPLRLANLVKGPPARRQAAPGWAPPKPAGISLCMIVRNEEDFLEAALRSVQGAVDEICIVDTGSTDATRDIARAAGARVSDVLWLDDFAHARNAALALATRRWIFVLDADERLEASSRETLRAIGSSPAQQRGKWIACRNLTDTAKGSGAMTNALVRIFPNDPRIRYRNAIHEFVTLDGCDSGLPSDRTAIEIVHHGYLDAVVIERAKGERNLRLSRRAVQRDPHDPFHQYNLAMALMLGGDRGAAIPALERMRELTRDTPRGYRAHGLVALAELYAAERADLTLAYSAATECLAFVPTYSNAHFVFGRLLAREGKFQAAREAFARAVQAGKHNRDHFVVDDEIAIWKAHSEIGGTLMHEHRYAQALMWFELGLQARPAAAPLMLNRAKCCEQLGDMEAAHRYFRAALEAHADGSCAIEYINFLFRCDRVDEALVAIESNLKNVDVTTQALLLGSAAAAHLRAAQLALARHAVERAISCAGRTAAHAIIRHLAQQFQMPMLAKLLVSAPPAHVSGLQIVYAGRQ